MNERIRKLAKKSGAIINEGFDGNKNFVYGITMSPEGLDKFSQLIVSECLVTLDSIVCDTSGERDTLWVARKVIAEHFGVE